MKRSTIQLAGKTLVVSLPNKWVRAYNIQKGDELDVEPNNDSLIVSCQKNPASKSIKIDISRVNYSIAWHYIISAYCKGFDEIEMVFENQTLKNNRDNTIMRTADAILRISEQLIGMEIVRQGKSSCLLKEVSKTQKEDFENILRRLFLLMLSISEDSAEALKNKDVEALKNILLLENNVNKFSHYCLRILNKFFGAERKDLVFIIRALEIIGDKCCFLIRSMKFDKMGLEAFRQLNLLIREFYEAFYSEKGEKISEFYEKISNFRNIMQKQDIKHKYVITEILDLTMDILGANMFLRE